MKKAVKKDKNTKTPKGLLIIYKILWIIFRVVPFMIFGFAIWFILLDIIALQDSVMLTSIAQVIIIFSATLAMLSFSYASAVKNKDTKKYDMAIYCGERFVQATVFSIIGFVLLYSGNSLIILYADEPSILTKSINIIGHIIKFLSYGFLTYSIVDVDFSLKALWKVANIGKYKYNTDDITQNWKM